MIVIIAPYFLQVTLVAGPPVEVQVRDLVVSLYTSLVAIGIPTTEESWPGLISLVVAGLQSIHAALEKQQ